MPDGTIFKNRSFKFETIAERLRELAFLNKEVSLEITDLRSKQEETEHFHFEGGIVEFVKYIDATRPSVMKKPVYAKGLGQRRERQDGRSRSVAPIQRSVFRKCFFVRQQHQHALKAERILSDFVLRLPAR